MSFASLDVDVGVALELALPADSPAAGVESAVCRGVLKAPVDSCCKRSNSSCSSFGSRGGEGPGVHDDFSEAADANDLWKKPGRTVRIALLMICMFVCERLRVIVVCRFGKKPEIF